MIEQLEKARKLVLEYKEISKSNNVMLTDYGVELIEWLIEHVEESEKGRHSGFVQGIAYAATMLNKHDFDAYDLIRHSGISTDEIRKHIEESDLKYLEYTLKSIEN